MVLYCSLTYTIPDYDPIPGTDICLKNGYSRHLGLAYITGIKTRLCPVWNFDTVLLPKGKLPESETVSESEFEYVNKPLLRILMYFAEEGQSRSVSELLLVQLWCSSEAGNTWTGRVARSYRSTWYQNNVRETRIVMLAGYPWIRKGSKI